MGQPIGFDFSQINCDVGKEAVTVDGSDLDGWEFQILTANIDSHKKTNLSPHLLSYLVAAASQHPQQHCLSRFGSQYEASKGIYKMCVVILSLI